MGREHFLSLLRQTDKAVRVGTISELVDEFIQHNIDDPEIAPDTIPTRRSHLKQFADFCIRIGITDIKLLNNLFINEYAIEYSRTHAKSTVNTDRRILRRFLSWVKEYKEIDLRVVPENIHVKRDKKHHYKYIDREVIQKVVDACQNRQDKLIISIFAETGVRIGELTRIKVSDIRKSREIKISGKGSKDRTVPITPILASGLKLFIEENGRKPQDYIFQNEAQYAGEPMKVKTVRRRIKKYFLETVGLEMTPHWLRHSMAIMLLLDGCDIVTIQNILGHEDINTTRLYLNITNPQRNAAYQAHIGKSFLA